MNRFFTRGGTRILRSSFELLAGIRLEDLSRRHGLVLVTEQRRPFPLENGPCLLDVIPGPFADDAEHLFADHIEDEGGLGPVGRPFSLRLHQAGHAVFEGLPVHRVIVVERVAHLPSLAQRGQHVAVEARHARVLRHARHDLFDLPADHPVRVQLQAVPLGVDPCDGPVVEPLDPRPGQRLLEPGDQLTLETLGRHLAERDGRRSLVEGFEAQVMLDGGDRRFLERVPAGHQVMLATLDDELPVVAEPRVLLLQQVAAMDEQVVPGIGRIGYVIGERRAAAMQRNADGVIRQQEMLERGRGWGWHGPKNRC